VPSSRPSAPAPAAAHSRPPRSRASPPQVKMGAYKYVSELWRRKQSDGA
jgi:hypothetical protein